MFEGGITKVEGGITKVEVIAYRRGRCLMLEVHLSFFLPSATLLLTSSFVIPASSFKQESDIGFPIIVVANNTGKGEEKNGNGNEDRANRTYF